MFDNTAMHAVPLFASALILCCMGVRTVVAQQLAPLPVEDVVSMRRLGEEIPMEFSPDGKLLAYVVCGRPHPGPSAEQMSSRNGVPWFALGCDIFVIDTENHDVKELTRNKGDNWLPAWSPNGRYLAFLSDRDEDGQSKVWIWDSSRNEIRKVSDVLIRMGGWQFIVWTPDSHKILVTTLPEGLSVDDYARVVTSGTQEKKEISFNLPSSTATVYKSGTVSSGEQPMPTSDPWNLDWALRDLGMIDVTSGKAVTLVHGKRINMFRLSPDGSFVVFSSPERFEQAGSQQVLFEIIALDLAAAGQRVVASNIRLTLPGAFSISPDNRRLTYRSSATAVSVIAINGQVPESTAHMESTTIAQEPPRPPQWPYSLLPLWDPEGNYVYYISSGSLWRRSRQGTENEVTHLEDYQITQLIAQGNTGVLLTYDGGGSTVVVARETSSKREAFFKVKVSTGAAVRLVQENACYTCAGAFEGRVAQFTPDRQLASYIVESAQHPAEIWLTDARFRERRRLTRLNSQIEKFETGSVRVIDWLDAHGDRLRGALILPAGYEDGKRYPLIVLVYGGATLSDFCNKFGGFEKGMPQFNVQLLATRGYAVLMPDVPQHLGTPMSDGINTVLPGVNKAIDLGVANPERLGVMGHSYGGYSTLSLIVQTNRFKAAIEADGYANLVGAYGELDDDGTAFGISVAETGQQMMGGTPWQFRDRYIENSPIFYLDRVQTPLLMIHGMADVDVLPFLGDEVYVGLRRLGKEVEYVRYRGEGHVISGYANQLDLASRMIAWFDRYLKNRVQ
jgi:dipeptidyl aminopeptidase/acylaminoacyl peptidase